MRSPPTNGAAERRLVLLLEDDEGLGRALKFELEIEGYDIELHSRGEDLLSRAPPASDFCIVADQNLPGLSGIETLEILRQRGINAPAVLITTEPPPAIRSRAARIQVIVLEKPLLGVKLLEIIRGFWPA